MRRLVAGVALVLALAAAVAWLLHHPDTTSPQSIAATPSADPAQLAASSGASPAAPAPPIDTPRTSIPETVAAAAFVVRGRVVRAADVPYPAARLEVERFLGCAAEGTPDARAELTCDADGRFEWRLLAPATDVLLRFAGAMPRHVGRTQTAVVVRGDPPPQDIELFVCPLDRVAVGKVTDVDGKPIAGACVRTWAERIACDAEGNYRAEFSSSYNEGRISAEAPGHVSERRTFGECDAGEVRADFRLRRGLRVSGRVVDAQDAPVAGAAVRSFFMLSDAVRTGADGRFVLADLDPDRASHMVFARAPGYVEAQVEVASRPVPVELKLVLLRGARVEGRVLAPDGAPVGGAEVYIGSSRAAYNRLDTMSKDDGTFVFPAVGAGEQRLVTTRRGLAADQRVLQVPKEATVVNTEVRLQAAHFVTGRVGDDAGQPIAGIRVSVMVPSINPRNMPGRGEYLDVEGKTGMDGAFHLDGLPAGRVILEFFGMSHVRKLMPDVAVDRDDIAVQLQRAASLAGRVVDAATSQPIATFRIRFIPPSLAAGEQRGSGYSATWAREGKSFVDANGTWRADGQQMQPGAIFGVEATADGYAPARNAHVVAALAPDPADCVLRLEPGATLLGRVLARSTGVPIAGATLTWVTGETELAEMQQEPYGLLRARTDEAGGFQLAGLAKGIGKLMVEASGVPRHMEGPFAIAAGSRIERTILLADGARIRGQLVDADGKPVAGVRLGLHGRQRSDAKRFATESRSDGSFTFAPLAAGDYELFGYALRDGVSTCYTRLLGVVADQDLEVRVAPEGTAVVRGAIDTDPPLTEDVTIMLLPTGPSAATRAAFRGAAKGTTFELRGATAGEYKLIMTAPDGRMGGTEVVLRDGAITNAKVSLAARR